MDKMIPRKNQLIMEAVSASEKATIQFRQYAAATLPPEQTGIDVILQTLTSRLSSRSLRKDTCHYTCRSCYPSAAMRIAPAIWQVCCERLSVRNTPISFRPSLCLCVGL
ncbi:MAG: hypothetical protein IKD29_10815 [Lentisphaeria bacterium]|nr:hypothetical protein [Lentisphaeria bacterium]